MCFFIRANDLNVLYINDADREPSRQCQCCLPLGCNVHAYTRTSHRLTQTRMPDVLCIPLTQIRGSRFLSRVHSHRAPPTVLNLMELEYAKMREDDLGARGDLPEFSPISPIYPKVAALILTRCRIIEERCENIKLYILLKSQV